MTDELKPTNPRNRKSKNFLHRVSPELVVRIRRMTMTTMVMEGLIPMKLLQAAQKFEQLTDAVNKGIATDGTNGGAAALADFDGTITKESLDFLRHYASVVVVEPKIVMEDDGNPDHLPVTELEAEELMGIFYATPPDQSEKEKEVVLTTEAAEDFRGKAWPEFATPAVRPVEDVPATPEFLDLPEREAIHQ